MLFFYFFNAGGTLMTSFRDEAVTIKGKFLSVAPGDRKRHLLLVSRKRQGCATRTTIYNYLLTNRKSLYGLSFYCKKTVTYSTVHPKHVNQGSLFKSRTGRGRPSRKVYRGAILLRIPAVRSDFAPF